MINKASQLLFSGIPPLKSSHLRCCRHFLLVRLHLHMFAYNQNPWNVESPVFHKMDRFSSPNSTSTVQNSFNNPDIHLPILEGCTLPRVNSKTGNYINIVTHCANLSQHCTATERSENAALLYSPTQVHITMPPRSILEAPDIWIPPYHGYTAVVPTVSALEAVYGYTTGCIQLGKRSMWYCCLWVL